MKKLLIAFSLFFFSASAPALAQTVVAPGSAGSHGIRWQSLMQFNGKYLQDDERAKAQLTPPLHKLLGSRYPEFMGSITTESPMEVDNGVLIVRGMMPHSGGDYAAAVYFGMDGALLAVLKSQKKIEYFGNKKFASNPVVAMSVKDLIN